EACLSVPSTCIEDIGVVDEFKACFSKAVSAGSLEAYASCQESFVGLCNEEPDPELVDDQDPIPSNSGVCEQGEVIYNLCTTTQNTDTCLDIATNFCSAIITTIIDNSVTNIDNSTNVNNTTNNNTTNNNTTNNNTINNTDNSQINQYYTPEPLVTQCNDGI